MLVSDLLVFFPSIACLWYGLRLCSANSVYSTKSRGGSAAFDILVLLCLHPVLLIVDHGHFQYNGWCGMCVTRLHVCEYSLHYVFVNHVLLLILHALCMILWALVGSGMQTSMVIFHWITLCKGAYQAMYPMSRALAL